MLSEVRFFLKLDVPDPASLADVDAPVYASGSDDPWMCLPHVPIFLSLQVYK